MCLHNYTQVSQAIGLQEMHFPLSLYIAAVLDEVPLHTLTQMIVHWI